MKIKHSFLLWGLVFLLFVSCGEKQKKPEDGQPVTRTHIPDFEDFGIGCFLLAAAEVYQLGDVDLNPTSSIYSATNDTQLISTRYYSIDGRPLSTPGEGITIIKNIYSDGTVQTGKSISNR